MHPVNNCLRAISQCGMQSQRSSKNEERRIQDENDVEDSACQHARCAVLQKVGQGVSGHSCIEDLRCRQLLREVCLCTQAVLPGMRVRRWGRIFNVPSIAARGPGSVSVAYNASKTGLEGLTRAYAARLAKEGMTVNAVAPGLVDTQIGAPFVKAGVVSRIPVGRVGTGDEIAQAVMLLVNDVCITGQTLAVNGGGLLL